MYFMLHFRITKIDSAGKWGKTLWNPEEQDAFWALCKWWHVSFNFSYTCLSFGIKLDHFHFYSGELHPDPIEKKLI